MKAVTKQYAVIGLGRFGMTICRELSEAGAQVLAIDINEDRVKEVSGYVAQAIIANCTIEDTVSELRLNEYDMVMVSIGNDVNASILTTLVLKEAKVKKVWVKANDKFQFKILQKIGADKIIMPERDMGVRVAQRMLDNRVFAFNELGSGMALTEIVIGSKLMGQTLGEVNLCRSDTIKVLGFKRGPDIDPSPSCDQVLEMGDMIIVAGPEKELYQKIRES
ncbi:TrkA family potassium uptake protein [Vibrio sp. SCSIO 43140]|uniref:potassium channel family protein n=1 Tax=Vibrio sp. SCSIO 43140 TaxID=2819100 RepID=UPI002076137B|nr:TrkA family potassium uptake protein [Vibrio sp. SCSIO 43140]USD63735.1 TrkA family potassium uptake protein [Vibrio sp. SCSIO 43140]